MFASTLTDRKNVSKKAIKTNLEYYFYPSDNAIAESTRLVLKVPMSRENHTDPLMDIT